MKRTIGIAILYIMCSGEMLGAAEPVRPPEFVNDVLPILTKLGCNTGGCHGKAAGRNGFKLSLLGFEPEFDYTALVREVRGRRLFPADPQRSLVLLKATAAVPHGGGKRLEVDSEAYRVLRDWIGHGAKPQLPAVPIVERIVVEPRQSLLTPKSKQPLAVTAHYSDGTTRDVTRWAVYQSNASEIAEADAGGLVATDQKRGLFAVMVSFGGQIDVLHGTVPFRENGTALSQDFAQLTGIDALLARQWQRLGIEPSELAGDATFIRRATVDICGTLPTTEEVTAYVADTKPDKRARLIDRLLERPEYASYFALKWADILRIQGRGYSTSQQREGTALFTGWIRDSLATNKPYDQFVAEILTATGSQRENPPAVWYRSVRTTNDYVESIAQAFLGVRIQCAQCHHHPAERWSQADYYGLAAVFARVGRKGGFADAEVPTNEIIYVKHSGEVRHPRTGRVMQPRPLGGPDFELTRYDDPRFALARWMTDPRNPFFARTMANRMWGHFLGRGIIDPIDDSRSTNPPSNPELLDALAEHFAASGYDIKHLIRVICNSIAYRLGAEPNASNGEDVQSFARFYPRRLKAEVLLDAISQVLEVPTPFPGGPGAFPPGTRAIDLPDENVPVPFLDIFGRPPRITSCECERTDAPGLGQALELVNSAEIQRKLTAADGYVARFSAGDASHAENVNDVWLRVFARAPRAEELSGAIEYLESASDRTEAYRSLVWSLLATNEFLMNH